MKTIGLIGGMSWESTVDYYKTINQVVKQQLGGLHSAKCVLYSVDFQEIEQYQFAGEWNKSAQVLIQAGQSLQAAGADFIIICTNTMHKVADDIQQAVDIPILHIAELTAEALKQAGIAKVGLLGTQFTMEQDFYKQKLTHSGIEVLIPNESDRALVSGVIYQELCLGIINQSSKAAYLTIINKLADEGAQAVILGCTEIGMLVNQNDTDVRLFDTTKIHAQRAALFALNK
jgi:aspartate racemase